MNKVYHTTVEDGWTKFPNWLLDEVMPVVSYPCWKVVCFLTRKTAGWHKDADACSYEQIMEGTGIRSRSTLTAALKELIVLGLVVATKVSRRRPVIYRIVRVERETNYSEAVSSSGDEPTKERKETENGTATEATPTGDGSVATVGVPDSDDSDMWGYHGKRDNAFSRACAESYENMETVTRITGRDAL